MERRGFIGIDPDSQQLVCMYMSYDSTDYLVKSFPSTHEGAKRFHQWTVSFPEVIIAFEGSNSHTRIFERVLHDNQQQYYTFKASDVELQRKKNLGPGKSNERDAWAVALLAKERHMNNTLDKWARYHRSDDGLRELCRSRLKLVEQMTAEISQLCKNVKSRDSELYLYLIGKHPDYEHKNNILSNKGTLNLLSAYPDLTSWKELSLEQICNVMHTNYKDKKKHVRDFKDLSNKAYAGSVGEIVLIKQSARAIIQIMDRLKEIESVIEEVSQNNKAVQLLTNSSLTNLKGIGLATAAMIVSEIIDIRRFSNNNKLAMYSGFGMEEKESGPERKNKGKRMQKYYYFNHRLKNAFMTMAMNVVRWNPDHRLTGMHKHNRQRGMIPTEALKRVARALVRKLFKLLWESKMEELESMKKGTGRQNGVKAPSRLSA